mgnify:FL=1
MKAHQLNEQGLIVNTIVVNDINVLPNLIDASIGGGIGDSIINGMLIIKPAQLPTKQEINATIYDQLLKIDQKSIRGLREGDNVRILSLESQAATLRAQLVP